MLIGSLLPYKLQANGVNPWVFAVVLHYWRWDSGFLHMVSGHSAVDLPLCILGVNPIRPKISKLKEQITDIRGHDDKDAVRH